MLCQQCGKENPDGVEFCQNCGAELGRSDASAGATAGSAPVEPGESISPPSGRRKRRIRLVAGAVVLVVLVYAAIGYYLRSRPFQMHALIPQGAPAVAAVDGAWLWTAMEDVRNQPDVKKGIADTEKELGISFEKDVVPWVGEVGATVTGVDLIKGPQVAFYVHVRDYGEFKKRIDKLQALVASKGGITWTDENYNGVKIKRADIAAGPPMNVLQVSTASVKGWFVVTLGSGTIEKIIDLSQGKAQSLADSDAWAQAFKRLPERRVAWFGIDGRELIAMVRRLNPAGAAVNPDLAGSVVVMSCSEQPEELRYDAAGVATSDAVRNTWREFKSKTAPVSDSALKQFPDDTFAVLLGSNIAMQWDQFERTLRATSGPESAQIAEGLRMLQPLKKAIDSLSGQFGGALVWKKGAGFGVVAVGETPSNAATQDAARSISSFTSSNGLPVKEKAGLYTVPASVFKDRYLNSLVCWKAKGKWLHLSSHPNWIADRGAKTGMTMPAEVRGTDMSAFGNLRFLPELLDQLSSDPRTASGKKAIDVIRRLGLEKAEWYGWYKMDPDGNWYQSSMVFKGWDWRKALKLAMDKITEETPKAD